MKKIDVITKYFYPQDGGIERSILETYSRLANAGFDVTIHTSTNTYVKNGVLAPKSKMKRLKVKREPKSSFDIWPKVKYWQTDYLILHNFNIFPHSIILFYSLILKILGKKRFYLVISPHGGMTPNYQNFQKFESFIKKWINLLLIRLLVNNTADSVRIVSLWEQNMVIKLGLNPKLLSQIPDGIENEAFDKRAREKKSKTDRLIKSLGKYIIQIGKIYPTKKYETTISALKYVKDKSVGLVIIGRAKDKNYKEALSKLAKDEDLAQRVHFIQFVTPVEKYRLLNNSLAFVLSSDWESFGRVAFEALSQGLPVIISDKTAPSLLISKGVIGYRFNNNNPKELAAAINSVTKIDDSKRLKKLKKTNQDFVKDYSWDRVFYAFKNLLNNLPKMSTIL